MLLPSDNETCPLFNQGLQGFRHKEVEETDPIFSVTYRYQVLSQTGETKLIQICISCLLSKAGDLHLRRIFRCQSGNGQLGPQSATDLHLRSNDHTGGNLYNHPLLIINFRLYLLVISGKREVETGNVVSVRLYSL